MGTQKNRLNETVLLSNQNICYKLSVRTYLRVYAENFYLSKPVFILHFLHVSLSVLRCLSLAVPCYDLEFPGHVFFLSLTESFKLVRDLKKLNVWIKCSKDHI